MLGFTPIRSVTVPEDGHGSSPSSRCCDWLLLSRRRAQAACDAGRDVGRLEARSRSTSAAECSSSSSRTSTGSLRSSAHPASMISGVGGDVAEGPCARVVAVVVRGCTDRNQPWFGSFTTEYLVEPPLRRLAVARQPAAGDSDLVEFLGTRSAKLAFRPCISSPAVAADLDHPADVVTVELLDDLVPAVERLLEELVTYYQQRLWDLGPNEERVVTACSHLGRLTDSHAAAEELGLEQRTIGTTMGRLSDARIVRGRKVQAPINGRRGTLRGTSPSPLPAVPHRRSP